MKNLFKKLFKRNNKNTTKANATLKVKRIFAGSAHTHDEMLEIKYRGMRQGYIPSVEVFQSSLGTVYNVYWY